MTKTVASAVNDEVVCSNESNELQLDSFLLRHGCFGGVRTEQPSGDLSASSLWCDKARARDVTLPELESAMMTSTLAGAAPLKACCQQWSHGGLKEQKAPETSSSCYPAAYNTLILCQSHVACGRGVGIALHVLLQLFSVGSVTSRCGCVNVSTGCESAMLSHLYLIW